MYIYIKTRNHQIWSTSSNHYNELYLLMVKNIMFMLYTYMYLIKPKINNIGVCFFCGKHSALMSKSKYWLALN